MIKIANILISVFLIFNLSNCKTVKNNKNPDTSPPKVEFSSHDLGESNFPEPKGRVNDFELIFAAEEIVKLTEIISDFEKETTNQIAIVSIKSIGEYKDFKKYAIDLSNYWGVGQKNKDNGLSIVFSKNLRKIRISTGNGTENTLTDEICKNIIDQTIVPEFKNGNYYIGIEKGLTELIAKWK